jgi:hypothetical protein
VGSAIKHDDRNVWVNGIGGERIGKHHATPQGLQRSLQNSCGKILSLLPLAIGLFKHFGDGGTGQNIMELIKQN